MRQYRIAFFDCSSGISGDMCLGALLDAGVSINLLSNELKKLPISDFKIHVKKVIRAGIVSKKANVIIKPVDRSRDFRFNWDYVSGVIKRSELNTNIKEKSIKVFKRLFEVEAKIHSKRIKDIHLHEIGVLDSIIDIVGTIICIDLLNIKEIYSSPVNLGSGHVNTIHGLMPVPTPATIELLKGSLVYSNNIPCELTTPTGAVLIKELAKSFGDMPLMNVEKVGIGAGDNDFKEWPNVLRVFIGRRENGINKDYNETITVIESNIDDMNPQIYEYVIEKLFKAGALDVFLNQIIMKKNRPGIKLTVLCPRELKNSLINIILKETTSLGVRYYDVNRIKLQRKIEKVKSEFGEIRVKIAFLDDKQMKISPEYEDCKKLSEKLNIPLVELMKKITYLCDKKNI